MVRVAWIFLTVLACFALPAQGSETASDRVQPAPLGVYGELPQVEDAAISTSGKFFAIVETVKGQRYLRVFDDAMKPVRAIPASGIKFRGIRFVGDKSLLFFSSATVKVYGFLSDKYEMMRALNIPLDRSGKIAGVFSRTRKLSGAIFGNYGVRKIGKDWHGYFGAIEFKRTVANQYVFDNGRPALYDVNLRTLSLTRVAHSPLPGIDRDWLVAADGTVAVTFNIELGNGNWEIRNAAGQVIAKGQNRDGSVNLIGLGKSGDTVIYNREDPETGDTHWFELPLAGGTPQPFLDDVRIVRSYWDPQTGSLLGYLKGGEDVQPVLFDPGQQEIANKIHRAFAGKRARLIDWTPDFSRVIVRTDGDRDSGSWYMVDLKTLRAVPIGFERPDLPPQRVGPASVFNYTAQDGLEMDGILTLPPSGADKNLPVVILPHGGPHAYDSDGFDWWAEAFASRGYAVFQPNFRGSTNRDDAFERAGYGEWGRKMQTDISDGLAALVAKGIVDPKRACIVGASYGGYAALAGVTLQHGIYRCAVAVAGVSDIGMMYRTDYRESDRAGLVKRSRMEELGPKSGWDDISPRKHAADADAPILLIHGKDDTVVEFNQSKSMADALGDNNKPYKLVVLDGEDHWLSSSDTRKQMLKEAVAWVEKYNPPD